MLRAELMLPTVKPAKVKELTDLAIQIVAYMDARQDYRPLIGRFNDICGGNYGIDAFDNAAGSMDMEDFAKQVLTPPPPKLSEITEDEYLEIIMRLLEGRATEAETTFWLRLLDINIPCPTIYDLIYWSEEEMTAEQVLAKARQWHPIIL